MRAVAAVCALALAACALGVIAGDHAEARNPLPIALGVNVAGAPAATAKLDHYAALAGRRPAIVMWYQQWSGPLFYRDQIKHTRAIGAIPMITWDPMLRGAGIPLESIADGSYNSYIVASARAAKAWGKQIYIRFGHEMNLPGSPFGPGQDGDTPALYVAAWRHVVSIFRREGTKNVEWVWSPNVYCDGKCPFSRFYPGDKWVNWVALDGYNYSVVDHVPWMSFDKIFGRSYRVLTALSSKPVMIGETASTELGGDKAQWIAQALEELPSRYPRIHALVWFDRVKETDWRVNSSPSSLAAWHRWATSTTYSGNATTLEAIAPFSG